MGDKNNLTILQLNDSHGYFNVHPELFWEGKREIYRRVGGYARISTLFNMIKKENRGAVITLDNGDTIHGTYGAVKSQGKALIPILNHLAFDGTTAHWEFAYGPKQFDKIVDKLDYPMLAINCYSKKKGHLVYQPYTLIEKNNLKVGIIGIAANIVDKTMPSHFSKGLRFTLGNQELPQYIEKLQKEEKVDLIVVVSHLGYPQELKLAEEIEGIDVLLSGHTHNRIYEAVSVNGTIIIQSGCHGSFIGRLDLQVSNKKVKKFKHKLIPVEENIKPDPVVEDMIDRIFRSKEEYLESIVGKTRTALNRSRVLESTMDNLLLKSIKEYTGAEIAFSNGWRYGIPILSGPITMNDIWNIIPTNPPLSICKLSGKELWRMMEENFEYTFSRNPYNQMGGYVKRCEGLNIYFKIENPKGKRIQEFFVGGKRIEKTKTYNACYLTEQGVPKIFGTEKKKLDIHAIEVLTNYLEKNDPINIDYKSSIVPI